MNNLHPQHSADITVITTTTTMKIPDGHTKIQVVSEVNTPGAAGVVAIWYRPHGSGIYIDSGQTLSLTVTTALELLTDKSVDSIQLVQTLFNGTSYKYHVSSWAGN